MLKKYKKSVFTSFTFDKTKNTTYRMKRTELGYSIVTRNGKKVFPFLVNMAAVSNLCNFYFTFTF